MIELKVVHEGKEIALRFEHSLRNLSKWESIHKKPWLTKDAKTGAEMLDYYQCMLLDPDVDPDLVYLLEPDQMEALTEYMNVDMTASKVPQETKSQYNAEITTTELIYFWMTGLKINWEAQDWHLSRLMMLISITSYKQQPPKKRNPKEVMSDWRTENERRKKLFKTSG